MTFDIKLTRLGFENACSIPCNSTSILEALPGKHDMKRHSPSILYSNALGFVTLVLIGQHQKFATVYPAIYCRKQFDVINYVTFHMMTCRIMRLAMVQFETKLQKCIRMGITIFNFAFGEVYRRIYIRKSHFTAPLARRRKTKFPTVYPKIYLPK